MTDELRAYRWAWAQQVDPDEKLLLLALAGGEAEPKLDELADRTGLGFGRTQRLAESLARRELVDEHLRPRIPADA